MAGLRSLLVAGLLSLTSAQSWIIEDGSGSLPEYTRDIWGPELLKLENHPHDCLNVINCLIDFPGSVPTLPDVIEPGLVLNPRRQARRGDQNCPSGRCYILDPRDICDGWGDHCVPIHNLRRPLVPCDPRNPECPTSGIYVTPDFSCHPFDSECEEGGVLVRPSSCSSCPTGWSLPDWFAPNGLSFNVTSPIRGWEPPAIHAPDRPGVIVRHHQKCPTNVPGCENGNGLIFDPERDSCRIGSPMCIGIDRLRNCQRLNLPANLCPSGNCLVCPYVSIHPNDDKASGVVVPPVPCRFPGKGCYGPLGRLPSIIIRCVPGFQSCQDGWQLTPDPDISTPDRLPIPGGNSLLVADPNGALRCSVIEVIPHTRPLQEPLVGGVAPTPVPDKQAEPVQPSPSTRPAPQQDPPPAPPSPPPPPAPPAPPKASFPCTTNDNNPCRGKIIRNWLVAANYWDWSGEFAKPNMPKRTQLGDTYFAKPAILEVVDSWFNNAHYNIWVDGEVAGYTGDIELRNNRVSCAGGDDCVAKGFSHAWVPIPAGNHRVEVGQIKGYVNGDNNVYTYLFTQFQTRLWEQCDTNSC